MIEAVREMNRRICSLCPAAGRRGLDCCGLCARLPPLFRCLFCVFLIRQVWLKSSWLVPRIRCGSVLGGFLRLKSTRFQLRVSKDTKKTSEEGPRSQLPPAAKKNRAPSLRESSALDFLAFAPESAEDREYGDLAISVVSCLLMPSLSAYFLGLLDLSLRAS